MNNLNQLVAHEIPLQGKHLIEASAGTGKTYNITRLYLRLLLEKRLTVEQILVMTFTKDATEELRGRIDTFIRLALNQWHTLVEEDEYFRVIAAQISAEEARTRLRQALLFLDEAAIYTIHGFCKRVLSQHAFASGLSFNASMENSDKDIINESCQDWYRILAQSQPLQFRQIAPYWSTPEQFVSQFSKAVSRRNQLDIVDENTISEAFIDTVQSALESLISHEGFLHEHLIDIKKGNDRQTRIDELNALKSWLEQVVDNVNHTKTKMPDSFFNGNRYSRSAHKSQLLDIFSPVKQVKEALKSLSGKIERARALVIIREGIYQIREQVVSKKRLRDQLSFDDLISTLADALEQEESATLAKQLFAQYPVALVDEFQDTDTQQFAILRAIYYHQTDAALFMIGDPKQAIYGFRGGDVFAYLSARNGCDYQWLMDTNWRSSQAMITAYNRLFYGNDLHDQAGDVFGYNIPYIPVNASPNAASKQLYSSNVNALHFVHFQPAQDSGAISKRSGNVVQGYRPQMAQWCASEIVRLLSDDNEALTAQDIAILVRDGAEASAIKQALDDCNLAAVFLSNRANLMHSEQASQLLQVLKGLVFAENERYYCAALASDLIGYSPNKLFDLQQDELAWQEYRYTFVALRDVWHKKGFISMALMLMHEHFTIAADDKDRALTNLLHLFEVLQSASQRHRQPQELMQWFELQINAETPEVEAELRLESDDNLIKIVTQHGAKGLEYPVVFVPFATRHKDPLMFGKKAHTLIEYHDSHGQLMMSLDGDKNAKQAMADEAYAESIRLLYVAVTRAEKRCYILATAFDKFHLSPLGKTLKWQEETNIKLGLQSLVDAYPNEISLVNVELLPEKISYEESEQHGNETSIAQFKGKIERNWWLSSFSALSRNVRHGGVSTPDRDGDLQTEHGLATSLETLADNYRIQNLLAFKLAKGAHTGNLLHDILEHTDFSNPDWSSSMKWPLTKYGELTQGYNEADLIAWLNSIVKAPLENSCSIKEPEESFCLASLTEPQTLRETEFYFPMENAKSEKLTELITQHRQRLTQAGEKVRRVELPSYQKLAGMMHGFVDLIFEHNGRYFVCDYKSSHLGDHYNFYSQEAMKENIEKNCYDLQYLIYSLALHRHLSFSLPHYTPEQHFGGVYYLYLRGMSDESDTKGCGVYFRDIEASELAKLDRIFAGEL